MISEEQMKHILEAQQASFMALLTEIQRNWGPASRENKRKQIERRITEFVYDPEGGVNFEAWFRKYEGLFEDEGAELDDKTKVEIMLLKLAQREHERVYASEAKYRRITVNPFRTNPFVTTPVPHPPPAAPPPDRTYTSGASPLLAPDVYEHGRNIRDWLCDLDLFLTDVPPHQHTCFLLRFLSPSAFDVGLSPATPFSLSPDAAYFNFLVLPIRQTSSKNGIAAERFATLRQAPRQSVDDFATELTRLASAAFPNLPHPDRDDLILHRFISGLLDRTITDSFLLHPPRTLNDALRQYRLYLTYHRAHQPPPRPPARPEPQTPDRRNPLPVRFPDHNPGCQYCAAFGSRARHCGHNTPYTVPPPTSVVGLAAQNQLKTLLNSFPDLFAWSTDTIGRTHLIQHTIDTGDAKPVWQPPRRIPVRYREEVNKMLDELLKAKIIQPSSSP
ncbi:hypothetical protein SprV_0301346500 [Sparganum proliferum]